MTRQDEALRVLTELRDQAGHVGLFDLSDAVEEVTREANGLSRILASMAAGAGHSVVEPDELEFIGRNVERLFERISKEWAKYYQRLQASPVEKVLQAAHRDCCQKPSTFLIEWGPVAKEGWLRPAFQKSGAAGPIPAVLKNEV